MLTDEEIEKIYGEETGFSTVTGYGSDIAIADFAHAIYKLGREDMRDDYKFCDNNCVWSDHHPDCVISKEIKP